MTSHAAKSELLSPAGDRECVRAAVANGADAVYFGLSDFNARHRAENFRVEELPELMAYLHAHNVRGYVAFNTLIFSDELPQAAEFVKAIAAAGADAVIVQDLGLVRLIRRLAPSLPIHGSTQMTLTEARGVEFVRRLGVDRVILARELSIDEIRKIRTLTDLPLEAFVHGALCIAYSGQCLTSESLGGRSANRGRCAQACRLPYDLLVDGEPRDLGEKAYLLSPQDLSAHDLLPELLAAGVTTFKIEGRLKSAQYVAVATKAYRAALDAATAARPFALPGGERTALEQSFTRGFSHGFLDGVDHQELVHARYSKNRGIRVGTVAGKTSRGVYIRLDSPMWEGSPSPDPRRDGRGTEAPPTPIIPPVKPGDGIAFDEGRPGWDEQGGRVYAVRPAGPGRIEVEFGRGDVNLSALPEGCIVWKTDDPALTKRAEQSYARDVVARPAPLTFRITASLGEPLRIEVSDGIGTGVEVVSDAPLARAEKHPATPELFQEQLGRLGGTPYSLGGIRLDRLDPVMVPKSVLNDLRRRAVERLMALSRNEAVHAIVDPEALARLRTEASPISRSSEFRLNEKPGSVDLYVLTRTMDQLAAVLDWTPPAGSARPALVYCDFEDIRRYAEAVDRARASGIPVGLATLRIVKPAEEGILRKIADFRPDALLVRNPAGLVLYREIAPGIPLLGDYSLNVANELTAALFAEAGLVRIVPSYDLTWEQMESMLARIDPGRFEVVLHQHMPMFHMEHCVIAHTLSTGKDHRDCGRPCDRHRTDLKDRAGAVHPLVADVGCRNTVFNGMAQSGAEYVPAMRRAGIRHFRIELLRQRPDDVAPLLDAYAGILSGRTGPDLAWKRLNAINRLGVTAGTLEKE